VTLTARRYGQSLPAVHPHMEVQPRISRLATPLTRIADRCGLPRDAAPPMVDFPRESPW
jgi:hypothetical protein